MYPTPDPDAAPPTDGLISEATAIRLLMAEVRQLRAANTDLWNKISGKINAPETPGKVHFMRTGDGRTLMISGNDAAFDVVELTSSTVDRPGHVATGAGRKRPAVTIDKDGLVSVSWAHPPAQDADT